jgi:hypothetical protein
LISGIFGSESGPVAETTTSAVSVPPDVSISQRRSSLCQRIVSTSWLKRMWERRRKVSAICSRYAWMCFCPEKARGHSGLGAKENE